MIARMIPNMASGNIAIRHKAKGPTLPVVTACATSAHAVGEAFRAIKHLSLIHISFEIVAEKSEGGDALATFKKAMDNVKPTLEVKPKRVGGAT